MILKFGNQQLGCNHITKVFQLNGYTNVIASDLYDYGNSSIHVGVDYLKYSLPDDTYDWTITNPPFSKAREFIEKAHSKGKPFAMLLKSNFWNSITREPLFWSTKPTCILQLCWRPDFSFKHMSGKSIMTCIWVIWDKRSFTTSDEDYKGAITFPVQKPLNYPKMDVSGNVTEPFNRLLI